MNKKQALNHFKNSNELLKMCYKKMINNGHLRTSQKHFLRELILFIEINNYYLNHEENKKETNAKTKIKNRRR